VLHHARTGAALQKMQRLGQDARQQLQTGGAAKAVVQVVSRTLKKSRLSDEDGMPTHSAETKHKPVVESFVLITFEVEIRQSFELVQHVEVDSLVCH
jgi:hypothetical protein